jgi:predicted nucleic acid-binding protein
MTGLVFVDTNVLLYALDDADLKKQSAARRWHAKLWRSRHGRISFQVLQEFYANVVEKWPESIDEARVEIKDLLAWQPVTIGISILENGWKIQDRYRLSFWDAMIVASAKAAACGFLLSEDFQPDQDLDGVVVKNPFLTDPDNLFHA